MIELLTSLAARLQHGRFISRGERLIVVDGAVWGRTRPFRAGGITEHRIYPMGSNEPLKGSARDYDALRRLVEDRMADGSLPAAVEAGRAVIEARRASLQADLQAYTERRAAEEAEWRQRAREAVDEILGGRSVTLESHTSAIELVLAAMRWARRQ